jgi:hypothetical protein
MARVRETGYAAFGLTHPCDPAAASR